MIGSVHESRHIACARCRDRKVKCDGGKPGCKRCNRNGTLCQYVRSRKENARSEWIQHLRTFSSQPGMGHHTCIIYYLLIRFIQDALILPVAKTVHRPTQSCPKHPICMHGTTKISRSKPGHRVPFYLNTKWSKQVAPRVIYIKKPH